MHNDCDAYEHKGVRAVEICEFNGNAGNQLASLVAQSGTSGSAIEFNSELRMGSDDIIWDDYGATLIYDSNKNAVEIVTSGAGNIAVRQAYNCVNIHGGRRIVGAFSAIYVGNKVGEGNMTSRAGLFDDSAQKTVGQLGSGAYIKFDEAQDLWYCGIASGYTGTDKFNEVKRDSWNIDKLDGTGPTELNLQLKKNLIHTFRIEIGTDRTQYVIFYYMYNGTPIPIHEFKLNTESTYVLTENLTMRYDVVGSSVTSSMYQMGSNVVSYGGRGMYSKVGVSLIESPNQIATSGGNEYFFMSVKNTDMVRLNTYITKLFFDADSDLQGQYFYKVYLRRNPATYIGTSYSTIYGTGAATSLAHDGVEFANLLADPNPFIISGGIWDAAETFEPFHDDNEFKIGNGIDGKSDEIVVTIKRTDTNANRDVWGGIEILQTC
jgi:hypothetical protein